MKKRNGEIDIFRFVFCLGIVALHFGNTFPVTNWFQNGFIGLEFFFIVSGYLMASHAYKLLNGGTQPFDSTQIPNETWRFIIGKVKSFFKYYIAAIVIQFFAWYVFIKKCSITTLFTYLYKSIPTLTLTEMVLNLEDKALYVAGAWYLSVMIIGMFILYPILLKNFEWASKIICPLLGLFITGWIFHTFDMALHVYNNWVGFAYVGILKGIAELSIGVACYALVPYIKKKASEARNQTMVALGVCIIKYGCYALSLAYCASLLPKPLELYAAIFVAIAVTLSFTQIGFFVQGNRLTNYLGKISLTIYIFHYVILRCLEGLIPVADVSKPEFVVMYVLTVIACIALQHIIDFVTKPRKKSPHQS